MPDRPIHTNPAPIGPFVDAQAQCPTLPHAPARQYAPRQHDTHTISPTYTLARRSQSYAGMTTHTRRETDPMPRPGRCPSCDQPLPGPVAHCPYCGRHNPTPLNGG